MATRNMNPTTINGPGRIDLGRPISGHALFPLSSVSSALEILPMLATVPNK